jgi:ribonuclease HII
LSRLHNSQPLYEYDLSLVNNTGAAVVGIDEAGRGPLAGPVTAAAVLLNLADPITGINDSKKISPQVRERLYGEITSRAIAWAVGEATPEEIDRHNILQATLLAMRRALDKIQIPWSLAVIDGNQAIGSLDKSRQRCIVRGDATSASIAAASILAKVTRDRMMIAYDRLYPAYGFAAHKGYGTDEHRSSIRRHGLCAIHRRSFCESLAGQTDLALGPVQ